MTGEAGKAGLTIYLFHIEPPLKHSRHYLGITPTRRLGVRFAEHQAGRGSRLTSAALASGSKLVVAALFHDATYAQEAQWKRQSHLSRRCPLCSGDLPQADARCYPAIVATSPPDGGWSPTDWRMPAITLRRPPARK